MLGPEPQEEAAAAELRWRAPLLDAELSRLHAAAFGAPWRARPGPSDWSAIPWAGSPPTAPGACWDSATWWGTAGATPSSWTSPWTPRSRDGGIGARILEEAIRRCRQGPRTQWLHVDFEEHLEGFYRAPGRFRPTKAGVLPV